MKRFLIWLAGFLEDQKGTASSKRLSLYILLWILNNIVNKSLGGGEVDSNLIYVVMLLILGFGGMITSEFFNKINIPFSSSSSAIKRGETTVAKT